MNPIAIYNIKKKELVAIFENLSEASKYLFPLLDRTKTTGKLFFAIKNKSKLDNTIFTFKVAIRYANSEQRTLLKKDQWYICLSYPRHFSTAKRVIAKVKPDKQPKNLKIYTLKKN